MSKDLAVIFCKPNFFGMMMKDGLSTSKHNPCGICNLKVSSRDELDCLQEFFRASKVVRE